MARENRAANRAKAKAESEGRQPTDTELMADAFEDNEIDETDDEVLGKPEDVTGENEPPVTKNAKNAADPDTKEEPSIFDENKGKVDSTKSAEAPKDEKKVEEKPIGPDGKPIEAETKPTDSPKEADPSKVEEPKPEKKEPEKKEEEPQGKQLSDEEATKLFSEWRGETEKALAEHHYRLTEKDVADFNENPASFIPKAMSRVYLDSIQAAFQQFSVYLPRMVDQVLTARRVRGDREKQFFDKWPELANHKETVYRLGTAYRTANPTSSTEDFINEVGAQAMVALRITPQAIQAQVPTEPVKPFVPAGTNGGTPPPPTPIIDNPFASLASAWSEEVADDE